MGIVYPFLFIYRKNTILKKKTFLENRRLNKFYLKKRLEHVFGQNNLQTYLDQVQFYQFSFF